MGVCAAAVLLVAAALKAEAVFGGTAAAQGGWSLLTFLTTPPVQAALIEFEIALATWLLWSASSAAWWATLAVFAAYSSFSAMLAVLGEPHCGCLGNVGASPIFMLMADVVITGLLWYLRPPLRGLSLALSGKALLGPCVVAGVGFVGAIAFATPLYDALLRFEGFVVVPSTNLVTASATGRSPEFQSAQIVLRNISSRPVTVVGIHPDCPSIRADNAPLKIAPGASETLNLIVPSGCGDQAARSSVFHSVLLYLDAASPRVSTRLRIDCPPG